MTNVRLCSRAKHLALSHFILTTNQCQNSLKFSLSVLWSPATISGMPANFLLPYLDMRKISHLQTPAPGGNFAFWCFVWSFSPDNPDKNLLKWTSVTSQLFACLSVSSKSAKVATGPDHDERVHLWSCLLSVLLLTVCQRKQGNSERCETWKNVVF